MEILQKNKVNIENAMHLIKVLFYLHKMHTYTAHNDNLNTWSACFFFEKNCIFLWFFFMKDLDKFVGVALCLYIGQKCAYLGHFRHPPPRTFLCRLGSVGVMCAVQVCCLGPARALTEQKTVDLVIGSYRRHEKIGALCLFFSQQWTFLIIFKT